MTPPRVMAAALFHLSTIESDSSYPAVQMESTICSIVLSKSISNWTASNLRKYVHKFGIKMHCEYILNGCVKNLRNLPCQRKRMIIFSILQIINGLPAHIEQLGEFCLGHIPVIAVILNSVFNHFHTPASLSAACAEKCGTFRSIYKLYHSYRRKWHNEKTNTNRLPSIGIAAYRIAQKLAKYNIIIGRGWEWKMK